MAELYQGAHYTNTAIVTADRCRLNPRYDLRNHNAAFEWGYGGSGPAQLALAILADATGDDEVALAFYQAFKWEVIAKLPKQAWTIHRADILAWLDEQQAALAAEADRQLTEDPAAPPNL